MTIPGDLYYRPNLDDYVLILSCNHYGQNVYQYRWFEFGRGMYGTYTNPHGDDLSNVGDGGVFRLVA